MPKDMEARQLIKQIPFVQVSDIETTAQSSTIVGDGWEQIDYAGGGMIWVWRGYIDLSGYTQNELTFFSQAVDIQKAQLPLLSLGTYWLNVVDLVTTRRLASDELYPNNFKNGFIGGPPDGNNIDIQEIIYGEWVSLTPYSATNVAAMVLGGDTFGTGNPTASDRIHCTRIISFNGAQSGESFSVGAVNYVIGGVTGQEKDLVYIERLRRAYTQERN